MCVCEKISNFKTPYLCLSNGTDDEGKEENQVQDTLGVACLVRKVFRYSPEMEDGLNV